ncbi:MAG: monovalent cation/H+ antiporter complex subunit F [Anaerolineae bacterium]|nr:monovalent cation/H+ antiporter complex subunit F [Anaerolineae bacterium]
MGSLVDGALAIALALHAGLLIVALWRLTRGENAADRLLALELVSVLLLCITLVVAALSRQSLYVDVGLGLAALSFIGTLALARYLANQRMF